MANFSFDIVSELNKAELNNVIDQVQREVGNRYDFKGTSVDIDWLNADKTGFKLTADNEMQLDSLIEVIRKKIASRNLDQKILNTNEEVVTTNMKVTKDLPFVHGLGQDKSKQVTKLLQASSLKVKTQIQGDAVRVTGSSKNDLQAAMQLIHQAEFDWPVSFNNYR